MASQRQNNNQNNNQNNALRFDNTQNNTTTGFDTAKTTGLANTTPTGTDLTTGIYGDTYSATQSDVDAGLATNVGDQLGNTISLPSAEQDLLKETLSDADKSADMKLGAIDDKFSNLTGMLETVEGDNLNTFDTKFDNIQTASNSLTQAQYDANRNQYQNVTDALRADRLGAMRRGESTTTGTGDRMRLEAEMRAANEYSNLDNAATLGEAERTLQNTTLKEGEKAGAKIDTATGMLDQMKQREDDRLTVADEVANVVGSTQEETLPAVKLAEQLIEQAVDEGNMEITTAEEKYQAIVDSTKELLQNPSLMQVLAEQTGNESIALDGEYTSEQQVMVNRINNLKNIPAFYNQIVNSVGAEMFAAYEALLGEFGAIYEIGTRMGLVDADGLPIIPSNQFGMTNTPESEINAAGDAIGEGSGADGDGDGPIDVNLDSNGLTVGVNL
jgi:hypothetical protein